MRGYRFVWRSSCTTLAVLGVVAGLATWPVATTSVGIAAALVGAVCASVLSHLSGTRFHHRRRAFVARGAAWSAVSATAVLGLATVLRGALLPVALVAVLCSPGSAARYHRWLTGAPRPSAEQFGVVMAAAAWASPAYVHVDPTPPLMLLTDEQLCQRWRNSCVELSSQSSTGLRVAAVEERGLLLDEVERRNPAGFLRWITSGAAQPATLLTNLSSTSAPRTDLDWDALLP